MDKKKVHKDQKYINALVENNTSIINSIYTTFAPKIINYIKNNNGNETNAKDIIQETLITIYQQATTKGLQLTCPFDAYFFLLCKRKWLNILKKNTNKEVTINDEIVSKDELLNEQVNDTATFESKQQLFNLMFEKLEKSCKDLLKTCFKIKSMEEVAKALKISYAYARKKKSQCTAKLTKLIKEAPQYHQLKG